MASDELKLERPHKLPRPVYLDDARLDKIMGAVLEMAAQLYVLHDRQRALEAVLKQHGIEVEAEISRFEPSPEWLAARKQERDAFIERLLHDFFEE